MPTIWRTSSYPGSGGNCVRIRGDLAAVRDSKHPEGPALPAPALSALVRVVKGR